MQPIPLTKRFPPVPLAELLEGIANFKTASLHAKQSFIDRVVAAHPMLSVDWGPGWHFRRARKLEDGDTLPESVDDLIWRKNKTPVMQRANPEGFQVLYVADKQETAFKEVHVEDSDVVLTEFSIRDGLKARIAPIGEIFHVQRCGRGNLLKGDCAKKISQILNNEGDANAKSIVIADAFLHHCLTDGADDYYVSSYAAKAIFTKLPEVSVVGFPSSQQSGAVNFAIRGDHLWEQWGIVSVKVGRAKHLAFGLYNYTNQSHVTGIFASGKLQWGDRHEGITILLSPPWTKT
ncbi:hypothetical protein ACLSSQ_10665 [Azospira sp. APE16]|jgi:hypothetical protein|uniref:hypothetical protein n=1 Tax=Azospira sp. APE16 TaxID=3394231 RepID=UPI003A4DBECC